MIEAARQTRDELQRRPFRPQGRRAAGGRSITMRSISRAVWRQDTELASLLMSSTSEGSRFLQLESGIVRWLHHGEFRRQFRSLHAAELE
eukprot:1786165-Pyramimonas_sp.AAC.1